jgi:hypothetical protein
LQGQARHDRGDDDIRPADAGAEHASTTERKLGTHFSLDADPRKSFEKRLEAMESELSLACTSVVDLKILPLLRRARCRNFKSKTTQVERI